MRIDTSGTCTNTACLAGARHGLALACVGLWLVLSAACDANCPPGSMKAGELCRVRRSVNDAAVEANDTTSSTSTQSVSKQPDENGEDKGQAGASQIGGAGGQGASTMTGSAAGSASLDSAGAAAEQPAAGEGEAGAGGASSQQAENGQAGGAGAGGAGHAGASGGGAAMPEPRCGDGVRNPGELCDGDCPKECPAAEGCIRSLLRGSAQTCDGECVPQEISETLPGDDCCPKGANAGMDSDCPKSCGDGIVDSNEKCEPKHAEKPCPSECDDGDPCTADMLSGEADKCTAQCVHRQITASASDQCCPAGANANTDPDCAAKCGNGVVEGDEKCDGKCPTSTSCRGSSGCMRQVLSGADCSAQCTTLEIKELQGGDGCCPSGANANTDSDCAAKCGNGVIEGNEKCDGKCPTSSSCRGSSGCVRQVLSGSECSAECTPMEIKELKAGDGCCPSGADATTDSDCTPKCGNGVIEGSEKCDGKCPTSASCTGGTGCMRQVLTGSGCSAECTPMEIKDLRAGDGCCPAGANMHTDSDCPAKCGNGVTEGTEKCDGKDCPTLASCEDGNPCTTDRLAGTAAGCDAVCVRELVGTGVKNACGGCTTLQYGYDADCEAKLDSCVNRGKYKCQGTDAVVCNAAVPVKSAEDCDHIDDDCDGKTDEGVLNECLGCGKPYYAPQAVPPGQPCAYYWTEDNAGDCATTGVGKCVGTDTVICDAPKPACAPP